MKTRFILIAVCSLVLFALGFYPLLAQQAVQQWPGVPPPFGLTGDALTPRPPAGQTLSPYIGLQLPSAGITPPQISTGSQVSSSDVSQIGRRHCGLVSLPQSPSSPSYPSASGSPQTIPVQGPWPGAPGVEANRSFQPPGPQTGLGKQPVDLAAPQGQFFYEPFSTIEAAYQAPTFPGEKSSELRQYGYSLFASPISTFAPISDVPVGPDYILGPGDDLLINVWGAMESGVARTVDRNGQIILPSVGPMRVWGLSFSQAERLIQEQLSRYYRGFQTSVTMGRLRTIRVYVVGEVCQPGSFTLSSLSTVTNALFAAGGSLKLGSLRKVELKRNHHTVGTLDLYDFLLRGDKTRDFRLESGDTIFVPPIGPIAAITGEVKRPAIYELQGITRVTDLIEMAGGLTPQSYLKRVQVIRTEPSAERQVIDLNLTNLTGDGDSPKDIELLNGDLVKVYATDPRIYNTINLAGAVKHPGEYELKPGMRLSQLLLRDGTLPEAYLERVEIARLRDDLTTEIIQVNLKQAWAGEEAQDISLRPRDQVTIRSEYRAPWKVMLSGEVKRPWTYTIKEGERLSSVLKRAGGVTDKAFLKGAVFTRSSVREMEKKKLDELVRSYEQLLLAEANQLPSTTSSLGKDEAVVQQAILAQRRKQLHLLSSKVTLGRVVINLDELDKLEGSPSDLILEDGDTLTIPQKPATVLVMGSVRNPTGVLYKEDMDVQYYLNRAGGLTREADEKEMYLLKGDGSAITGFMRLRNIEPGDVVIVPPSTEPRVQWLLLLKDLVTIASQFALGLAGLAAIF